MLAKLLHLIGVANFGYALYFDVFLLDMPATAPRNKFGGPWKYLTFWNLWIQLAYNILSLYIEIFGHKSKLNKIRNFFFSTIAFPIGFAVGAMFWGLYAIDRELVFSAKYDAYIPSYINHMYHTTVNPLLILQLFVIHHRYPKIWIGLITTGTFCFIYFSWVMIVAHFGGIWVYPIFKVLTPFFRILFILICCLLGGILYLMGHFINQSVWRNPKSDEKTTQSQPVKYRRKGKKTRLD